MATKEQINFFLSDPDYVSLIELEREQRLLFITDMTERRVSAFLAWLFNPHEGHGLSDRAVRDLLLNVWLKNKSEELNCDPPDPKNIMESSFRDLIVATEYSVEKSSETNKRRSIDLVLISRRNKLIVVIENKFGSTAHTSQLKDYRLAVNKRYSDYRKVFVYLDWNPDNKPDDKEWIALDYQWLIKLIATQQEAGLLSVRALDALGQVKDYLSQDGAKSSDSETKKDRLIEAIASRHSAVLDVFRSFDNVAWQKTIEDISITINEPLLIEFNQRWSLWRDVLAQSHHAKIIFEAKKKFGDEIEVSSGPTEVYFRFKSWHRFESEDAEFWGPRVSAWCGRETAEKYDVWVGIVFKSVKPERELEVREAAKELRDTKLKAPPKAAQWIRLSRQDQLSISEATSAVINALEKLNSVFKKLP
jgi:PD-(D/E)XK nuclease superfamily